jgi:SAM-dependent methyltransferase
MISQGTISQDDPARLGYFETRRAHWDAVGRMRDSWRGMGGAYHRRLAELYRFLIPAGGRVLEAGSGSGDLLAVLRPARGVGVDFSPEMVSRARAKYPQLTFVEADAHELPPLEGPFDAIILSDLVNDVWDVQCVLEGLRPHCAGHTRLVLNYHSGLWELPLRIAQRLRLASPMLDQNWLTNEDVADLLNLAGFEVIRSWQEILLPLSIPLLNTFFNKFLVKLPLFRSLALTNFMVARPQPAREPSGAPGVSVIVPARNEAGNIPAIFARLPRMGSSTEIIFVEGHSKDNTYSAIEREMAAHPEWECQLVRQSGTGKADAVRAGFAAARGEVLMILDADLTVPPEDLPRFYEALVSGKGELINGVRLVYPMEREAMRGLNLLGNKLFSLAFSWLLGQPVKDTLCGTKVLFRRDYERIAANRAYFGEFDPFGDFDLIFGAAKLNLKIIDLPIRYRERTYGSTNIHRWRHGWLLMKMVAFAAARIKFV